MQSSAFSHAFQSTTFAVSEFVEGSERPSRPNSIPTKNSPPDDTFSMENTFIRTPGPGSGNGKRYKPSCAAVRGIVKKSRITIKNKDNLCCACAIVTMKALADADGNTRDQDYYNLKQGNDLLKNFTSSLESPKDPAQSPNSHDFRPPYPTIRSTSCPLIHHT